MGINASDILIVTHEESELLNRQCGLQREGVNFVAELYLRR